MSTAEQAREAIKKMASVDTSDDAKVSLSWLEGIGAHCKEAGLDPDQVLDAIDPNILKSAMHGYGSHYSGKKKKKRGERYDHMMDSMKKKSQATKEELAAGAMKNVKKKTPEAPQLDQGAAAAAKTLES